MKYKACDGGKCTPSYDVLTNADTPSMATKMRVSLMVNNTITIMQDNSMYMLRSGFRTRKALRMVTEAITSSVRFTPEQLIDAIKRARQENRDADPK